MNAQTVRLLRILSACRPDDETLALESLLTSILSSADYQTLQHRQAFAGLMQEYFSEAKLRTYSVEQLHRVEQVLPILSDCLDNLLFSLKNGDCPALTSADRPDFTDPAALALLRDRLEEGTGKNYCNIADKDFLCIFDETTVKSLRPYFLDLPQPCEDYEAAIRQLLAGKSYCIRASEVEALETEYRDKADAYLKMLGTKRTQRFRICLGKGFFGLFVVGLPVLVASLTGMLTSSVTHGLMVFLFLCTIAFWRKG
ncbi:hypothetical protein [uncultured Mitsuokella sp.]|uniref:hypothetical protein n=1 Tax=uncultured Mitsuokella sp. TaxID=453120 RepID=UPI00261A8F57|nr:hypothetical protein [uncultured Mitsuokella sp.]